MRKSDTDKDQYKREKQDRLSKALRDNLFRRKQQMRSRKQAAVHAPVDTDVLSSSADPKPSEES